MPIWNKEAECASNEAREKQQLERLQKTVERVYARVPFYREKLDRSGINPDSITSLKDIAKLPFTANAEHGRPVDGPKRGRVDLCVAN